MIGKGSSLSPNQRLKNMQRKGWGRINQQRLSFIKKYAGHKVLDVGCARGDYVTFLNKHGHQAFGLDILTYEEWRQVNLKLNIQGEVPHLPFPNQTFDTLLAFEILEHIPKPELAVQEFFRASRKNLIISVPDCSLNDDLLRAGLVYSHWIDSSHFNFFDQESLRIILEENGFRIQVLTKINQILPDFIPLRSWHIPYKLAFQLSRLTARLPMRKQYQMTLLAVASRNLALCGNETK
jgi:SAM-dependent methyltransferase